VGALVAGFVIGAVLALVGVAFWARSRQRAVAAPLVKVEQIRQPRSHPLVSHSGRTLADERIGHRTTPGRGFRTSILTSLQTPLGVDGVEATERELADDLRGYLGDVAAQHGAEDAMLWLRATESAPFHSMAWNRDGGPPSVPWGSEQQRALVAWAAGEGVVTFDSADGPPSLAAARVDLDAVAALGGAAQAGGALVLHSEGGIQGSRSDLKLWLPRHAQRIAQLVELQVTRNEVARANRQLRVLARNAQEMQVTGEQEVLERRIADSVLEASGASFAALVAWDPELRRGAVRRVTSGYPEPVPLADHPVEPESLVGSVCLDGNPRLWEDASPIAGKEALFAAGALVPQTGTLAILALQRGGHTIGAIVIGAKETGVIRPNDLRTAKLIAQLAASALEAAWEIEEVSRRSRTDQLTGLWNRRHFDEHLVRVLNESERYHRTCALVLADVDHFKQVNDTLGHEAGDEVLKMVADVLREVVRTTDICARIGGEEFCMIIPETALSGAVELAERIRLNLEESTLRWRGKEIQVTASFGVATYEAGGGTERRDHFFEMADRAMYRAKSDGRNCVRAE
jgi:diguanylate cyclase (GGDEF)-like protein